MIRNLSNKLVSGEATAPDEKSDTQALPSSWYRTPALFNLERRALFSKRWLLVTHRMRITEPGDYLSFEIAGFPFLLCIDRQGVLRGFHNVCRHRAFPVVGNDSGKANILACKYHGWSYGLNGNLAKAPKYETIPDFDKKRNGLFPIHIHVDKRGFIWVNLDAGERPSVPWSTEFLGADEQDRLDDFKMNEYSFDHAWTMNGEFNWKTLLDNYNECYHCSVAHPGITAVSNLSTYKVEAQGGYIKHFVEDKPGYDSQMKVAPTFLFPNVTVTMTTHYFYLMRVNPTSATTTILQYEVYRHKDAPTEVFDELDAFFKQVEGEDKQLCEGAQRNLNAGVYVNGVLHPSTEKGVLYFQTLVRSALLKHHEAEESEGREIWPSVNKVQEGTKTRSELDFCVKLDCGTDEGLAW